MRQICRSALQWSRRRAQPTVGDSGRPRPSLDRIPASDEFAAEEIPESDFEALWWSAEGVDAQLHAAFGHEALPTGLMVVTGTKA